MKRLTKDQNGLAAILITMFILLMLTLVVLAFSQVTRREQRQSLDRQLSAQAFYAAESGVNEAIKFIKTDTNPATMIIERKLCTDPPSVLQNNNLDTGANFKYSCVLFDRAPPSIEFSDVDTESGEFISLKTATNDLTTLIIIWNDTDGGANFVSCPVFGSPFPAQGAYSSNCDAGMLRVLLMPFSHGNNRQQLTDKSYTAFLRPVPPGAFSTTAFLPHSLGANTQGEPISASCTTASGRCRMEIAGVPGNIPNGELYLHIRSIYKNSAVTIEGRNAAGLPVRFTSAQVKIDSTGKVADVLKRIQVRVPMQDKQEIPGFVTESANGICKQLDVYPGHAASPCGALNP